MRCRVRAGSLKSRGQSKLWNAINGARRTRVVVMTVIVALSGALYAGARCGGAAARRMPESASRHKRRSGMLRSLVT